MNENRTTELLRKLLDENGIEWKSGRTNENNTSWDVGDLRITAKELSDGTLLIQQYSRKHFTPEQAIAATLGSKTCIVIHDLVTHDFRCSNCGKQIGVVRNCEMYETCDGQQAWKSLDHEVCDIPNFCPNCGAKVVKR